MVSKADYSWSRPLWGPLNLIEKRVLAFTLLVTVLEVCLFQIVGELVDGDIFPSNFLQISPQARFFNLKNPIKICRRLLHQSKAIYIFGLLNFKTGSVTETGHNNYEHEIRLVQRKFVGFYYQLNRIWNLEIWNKFKQ